MTNGETGQPSAVADSADQLTTADAEYIRESFFRLEELCAGRSETVEETRGLIARGVLPRAAYELDGEEWFPADLFLLLDRAGAPDCVQAEFERGLRASGGTADDVASAWQSYLSGEYAWCLREATPENMMRKAQLIDTIEPLLADPRPDDAGWRAQLRRAVWSMETIERPFAPDLDRSGRLGGPPSYDRYVVESRRRYAEAFATDKS